MSKIVDLKVGDFITILKYELIKIEIRGVEFMKNKLFAIVITLVFLMTGLSV